MTVLECIKAAQAKHSVDHPLLNAFADLPAKRKVRDIAISTVIVKWTAADGPAGFPKAFELAVAELEAEGV